MKPLLPLTLIAASVMAFPPGAEPIGPEALDTLPDAQIVILGEVHDNVIHHRHQARAIAALRPAAVVWEMLTPDQAAGMPEATADRADADRVAAAIDWNGRGWPDFALYHPLVTAAGDARHYGAGVPRAEARRAFAEGAAAVLGADAARFGLDRALPADEQDARETEQFDAHCQAMPREMMGGMVEAQRLRDAALARAALAALAETGGPVAVITGSGHAHRQRGVPAMLALAAPSVTVLSIGQVESDPGADAPFDLWIVTDPQPRPDPCATLR